MTNFSNMSDAKLLSWMKNFVGTTKDDPESFGVTAEQVANIETKMEDLEEKMAARYTAAEAARAAVVAQKLSRLSALPDCSFLATIIRKNQKIPDANKVHAAVPPRKAPAYTPPVAPFGLTVSGDETGTNFLKWKRAGNKSNTLFIIECRADGDEHFKFLGMATRTTYEQKNAIVGKQCLYRVKAQRAGEQSGYSNTAVVYMK